MAAATEPVIYTSDGMITAKDITVERDDMLGEPDTWKTDEEKELGIATEQYGLKVLDALDGETMVHNKKEELTGIAMQMLGFTNGYEFAKTGKVSA